MIIRTISQLPKVDNDIEDTSLFELSKKVDEKYISKAANFGKIKQQIVGNAIEEVGVTYNLIDGKNVIDVSKIKETVDLLKSGDLSCNGNKTFFGNVDVVPGPTLDERKPYNVANVQYVDDALENISMYIGSKSNYTAAVTADSIVLNPEHILKLYFNDKAQVTNEVEIPKSGNLVMYGWLADNGNIDTATAWVALEGKVNESWIIIQLQPWILGNKHENLQYVGFNCPVAKGMKIRVATGFMLNYSNSTYQNRKNSLVKNIASEGINMTNAFLGYVIY